MESGAQTLYTTKTGCSPHGPSTDLAVEELGICEAPAKQGYLTEDYAVKKHWVRKILNVFNIPKEEQCRLRDAFASSGNARFEKFTTSQEDSLVCDWDPEDIMWTNPPWSIWPAVSTKILSSRSMTIAIIPVWKKWWVEQLVTRAHKLIYYEVGTLLFEYYGKPVPGIRWAVYALLLIPPTPIFTVNVVQTRSRAARRRWRRKKQQRGVA